GRTSTDAHSRPGGGAPEGVPNTRGMATAHTIEGTRRITDLTFDFLGYLELERGLSRNTLEAYRSDLQQFGDFLDRRDLDPLDVKTVDLMEFVSEFANGTDD